jgi:copper chaperone CopZ
LAAALSPISAFAADNVEVKVTGMTCGACVSKVQDALAKLGGVEKGTVKVELAGNKATLMVAKLDDKMKSAITDAVKAAGYTATEVAMTTAAAAPTTTETKKTKKN